MVALTPAQRVIANERYTSFLIIAQQDAATPFLQCSHCHASEPHALVKIAGLFALVCWSCGLTSRRITH